jgi:hypothetical protein
LPAPADNFALVKPARAGTPSRLRGGSLRLGDEKRRVLMEQVWERASKR